MSWKVRTRYQPAGAFAADESGQPDYRDGLLAVADAIAGTANARGPRRFMGAGRGYGSQQAGTGAQVTGAPGWNLVEFGTRYTAPHATLRKAVEACGLRLEGS